MDKIIRVAIAGFGRSGCGIHGKYFATDPRFKVIAVADNLPDRRKDAVDMFNCQTYESFEEMIAKGGFDLLVNATPSPFHVACSKMGLEHGFNVIGEKPSAPTVAEFDMLVATAEKNKCLFMPYQNSRFYPFFIKMREVIASGVLGKIVCIRSNWSGFGRRWDWQTRQENIAGNLFNTGPHPVDQAIVLFGEGMPKVFCRMDSVQHGLGGDADNFCTVSLYGEGHPLIEIQISSLQAYPQGEMYNIQAEFGGLTGGPNGLKWKYFDPAKAPKQEFWKPWSKNREYCSEKLEWIEKEWTFDNSESNASGFKGLSAAIYENYYNVMVNNAPRVITLDQVRRQVYVMEEAHRQNPLPKTPRP
ncbi:MAG: Gfo/Idh/MocA family oxidoreductase [Lentisphaeria bacterium]|nr:Gfo/Idh/MocA family oxidoreductase [Lentisphaeria bacterium]